MVAVEEAWLDALAGSGIAPASVAKLDLQRLVGAQHLPVVAAESERGGNPAAALVDVLRAALADVHADGARWLHRGLTSQDVVDTALMLCARDAVGVVTSALREQVRLLADLVEQHRRTPMVARTLTQHAVPTTFGLKAAGWLTGVLDAYDAASALVLPVQVGGAAGTMAATVELAGHLDDPVAATTALTLELATALGLTASTPWHTTRSTVTRLGDAASAAPTPGAGSPPTCSPSAGPRSASCPRAPAAARRPCRTRPTPCSPRSSAAPRSATPASRPRSTSRLPTPATSAPPAPGTPSGTPCAPCCAGPSSPPARRPSCVAGLEVHPDRMAATLDAARDAVRSEQRAMADLAGRAPPGRLPRRRRRLHRGPAGQGGRGPRMIPVVTGVRMSGAAHRAELPLLVLGPSLGTNAVELWTACADRLTDSFDVLAWDLPGHGHNRSVSDEGFTMAELADGRARAGRRHPGATGRHRARRSPTPASPSAAPSGSSCSSTTRTASRPPP